MGSPRVSNREKDRKFTLREVLIAVGKVSGATMDEVADQVGVTKRALYYDMAAEGVIAMLAEKIGPLVKHTRREIKQIAIAMMDKEFEKLGGAAISAISDALTGGADPKTAAQLGMEVYRQLRGMPTSTVRMQASGTVTHRHELYVMDRKTLAAFSQDAIADTDLMATARQLAPKVIDVEPR